jgi:hypothetical protein
LKKRVCLCRRTKRVIPDRMMKRIHFPKTM